jgi:hypothetical protein
MPTRHREERSDVAIHANSSSRGAQRRGDPCLHEAMDCHGLRPRNDGFVFVKTWSKSPVPSLQQTF